MMFMIIVVLAQVQGWAWLIVLMMILLAFFIISIFVSALRYLYRPHSGSSTVSTVSMLLSLLLLLNLSVLWLRSNFDYFGRDDYIEWSTASGTRYHVRANSDRIVAFAFLGERIFGFENIYLPYWLIFPIASALPVEKLVKCLRTRRRVVGFPVIVSEDSERT